MRLGIFCFLRRGTAEQRIGPFLITFADTENEPIACTRRAIAAGYENRED